MKVPRDASGREVARALKRLGFDDDGQRGSHMYFRKTHFRVTVPNHDAIHPKTLQSIVRQAGITMDELIAEL